MTVDQGALVAVDLSGPPEGPVVSAQLRDGTWRSEVETTAGRWCCRAPVRSGWGELVRIAVDLEACRPLDHDGGGVSADRRG
jgi:hypothetical protein